VLIVIEDEESVRDIIETVLVREGYEVLLAVDGIVGEQLVAEHARRASLVVLDWNVPGRSGTELHAAIRRASPTLPILVTSGSTDGELTAVLEGDRYSVSLSKPWRIRALVSLVTQLLSGASG
jgi:DNA-binding response OmpR family regulator